MIKNYGLLYVGKDDKEYLYRSYYTMDEVAAALESKEFKAIEKKKIIVIKLEEKIIENVDINLEVK